MGFHLERKSNDGKERQGPQNSTCVSQMERWTSKPQDSLGSDLFCSPSCWPAGAAGTGSLILSALGLRCRLWAPLTDKQAGAGWPGVPGSVAGRRAGGLQECVNTSSWLLSDAGPAVTSASPIVNIPARL